MAADARTEKPKEHLRIGEVCRLTATKAFVLRYWETEFPMLRPLKTPKGHRLYRRQDIETVLEIKRLLYEEGFTIAGARRHLREQGSNGDSATAPRRSESAPGLSRGALQELRDELREILTLLERG
jgi:DNA-binding transcriptional MerR regulator